MKVFYSIIPALSLAIAGMLGIDASARPASVSARQEVNVTDLMRRMAPEAGAFTSVRAQKAAQISRSVVEKAGALMAAPEYVTSTPDMTFGPELLRDLDGPDGKLWYYTKKLVNRSIDHEYYRENILEEYSFDIYDNDMKYVGTVHDKMRYEADELRVPGGDYGIDILPVITKNFFNTDDLYEVVVSIAVNTTTPGVNRYYSVVYSLNGATEVLPVYNPETGEYENKDCDKILARYNAFVGDVLNNSQGDNEEIYITFMSESFAGQDVAPADEQNVEGETPDTSYWDAVCSYMNSYHTFGKVDESGALRHVLTCDIPAIQLQGDQQDTAPLLSLVHNNTCYLVKPYYEQPFYDPYYSAYDDMSMRKGNNLVIELYKIVDCKASLVSTTKIPVEKFDRDDVLATYYSVGDLRYAKDVDFGNLGSENSPAFYITRCNYVSSIDDKTDFCYYVYNAGGEKIRTIFENADSDMELTSFDGCRPEHLFVDYDDDGNFRYNMVDLIDGFSAEKTVRICSLLKFDEEDEGDLMMANVDRVAQADGSHKYAFEMRVPGVDDDENDIMRVAWFDSKGEFDRIDEINMGKNVYFAQTYINGVALDRNLFTDQDDEHEYMVLIKRGISDSDSSSQEECFIAQPVSESNPSGKTLLHLTPGDKGALANIGIYPSAEGYSLQVVYAGNGYHTDIYKLPFKLDAIDSITDGIASGNISYDGTALRAEGSLKVYSLKGILVAEGVAEVNVSNLPAGVYVAIAGDKAYKFSK